MQPITLQPLSQDDIKRARVTEKSHPGLPAELLQDISRRLQFISLLMIGLSLLRLIVHSGVSTQQGLWLGGIVMRIAVSAGVFFVARRQSLSPSRLLDLGLGYEVFLAVVTALATVPATWAQGARSPLLWSPVAVLVVIYPVIVPSLTLRALTAAALSASTEPLAVLLFAKLGVLPMPAPSGFALVLFESVVAVAIAVAISRMLYRMGEQLSKAKAMGSYHLVEKLGAGGMGEVWSATHRFLARPAAIKLVRREELGAGNEPAITTMLQRFEREAQATAALQSPHTIDVYDFGIARDGTFYYVMELLNGLDLASLVEHHGPQTPERVVHILRQACDSLYEAHQRGLIHRDIKPANIFLCRYATEVDFVKVLDFGLVKNVDTSQRPELQVTQAGVVAGTPGFMAPEAVAGLGAVDGRADLYALGCVAYWLLTGKEVFRGPTTMSVLLAHLKETPPPLSAAASQPIPEGLERIIQGCLEKDPAKRPATAHLLSRQLAELNLEPLWDEERAAAWWAEFRPQPRVSVPSREASEAPTQRLVPLA
jgi:serine/threonine-protein kinase